MRRGQTQRLFPLSPAVKASAGRQATLRHKRATEWQTPPNKGGLRNRFPVTRAGSGPPGLVTFLAVRWTRTNLLLCKEDRKPERIHCYLPPAYAPMSLRRPAV